MPSANVSTATGGEAWVLQQLAEGEFEIIHGCLDLSASGTLRSVEFRVFDPEGCVLISLVSS